MVRELLIQRRKKKGITQQEMANLLGIARSTYSAYELGNIDPPLKISTKIKEILNYRNDNIFLISNVSKTDKITTDKEE